MFPTMPTLNESIINVNTSFLVMSLLLLFRIPYLVLDDDELVKRYYNNTTALFIELLLYIISLFVLYYVYYVYNITGMFSKLAIANGYSFGLCVSSMYLLKQYAEKTNIYNIWYEQFKNKAIIYEMFIVTSLVLFKEFVYKRNFHLNN